MGWQHNPRMGAPRNNLWIASFIFALVGGATSACTFVLDSKSNQCNIDSDCSNFAGFPSCQNGVCVASNLGPPGCIATEPMKQMDYLNACTTSKFVKYDNCDQIGYGCPDKQVSLPQPAGAQNGTAGSSMNPPDPTDLCTLGAPMIGNSSTPAMIWMYGSSDFGPLLKAAQPSLSAAMQPYRAVFQNATSCQGVTQVFGKGSMADPTTSGTGGWPFYFAPDPTDRTKLVQVNCRISPMTAPNSVTEPVDIGVSDLFAPTCPGGFNPGSTVNDYTGPVVPFVFAVKAQSAQQAISAEAAHLVFGNGGHAPMGSGMKDAAPWTDYMKYFIRNSNAGSTILASLLIDVPRNSFWGIDRVNTDNVRDGLLAVSDSASGGAIGILSMDYADKNRGNLKALFLQAKNQTAGYLPDSGPNTTDKLNVRDGHYALWGYVHLFTALNPQQLPSAAALAMTKLFSVPNLDQGLVDNIIGASLIPQCAMQVERTEEIGDYQTRHAFSCGCYFDVKTTGSTSCKTCSSPSDCVGDPTHAFCNYGYCDTQG